MAARGGEGREEQPSGCDWREGLLGLLGAPRSGALKRLMTTRQRRLCYTAALGCWFSALECVTQCGGDDEGREEEQISLVNVLF